MNTASQARSHRPSEGTASARTILGDTSRAQMPRPYLLDKGEFPIRKPAPLRLIKTAPEPSVCGFGVCELKPECTSRCRYRQADEALRGHYSARHSLKQDLPPLPTPEERRQGHQQRRAVILGLGLFWVVVIGVAAWIAWGA